jgi:HSP20 family protein
MNLTVYRNPARALSAWAPFYRPINLLDDIGQIARDFWSSWQPDFLDMPLVPHNDVYEEKGQLVVKTELPGIIEKDLEVTLEGDVLSIKAEKKGEVIKDATNHTRERYYGKYVRSMSLPSRVDGEKISASFDKGVLELRIPKGEEAEPKIIEVKAQLPKTKSGKRHRKIKIEAR